MLPPKPIINLTIDFNIDKFKAKYKHLCKWSMCSFERAPAQIPGCYILMRKNPCLWKNPCSQPCHPGTWNYYYYYFVVGWLYFLPLFKGQGMISGVFAQVSFNTHKHDIYLEIVFLYLIISLKLKERMKGTCANSINFQTF